MARDVGEAAPHTDQVEAKVDTGRRREYGWQRQSEVFEPLPYRGQTGTRLCPAAQKRLGALGQLADDRLGRLNAPHRAY